MGWPGGEAWGVPIGAASEDGLIVSEVVGWWGCPQRWDRTPGSLPNMIVNNAAACNNKVIRYGVVANISRSHNLRDQFRGAQGSIPCTGESSFLPSLGLSFLFVPVTI